MKQNIKGLVLRYKLNHKNVKGWSCQGRILN